MTNSADDAGQPTRGLRLSRTFFGAEAEQPIDASTSSRPSNTRTVSDQQVPRTAPSGRAPTSSSRTSSGFSSLFRSRVDSPPTQQQQQQQQRPPPPMQSHSASSARPTSATPQLVQQLPPPLPNPYETYNRPSAPHSAGFSASANGLASRPYASAPAQQGNFALHGASYHAYRPPAPAQQVSYTGPAASYGPPTMQHAGQQRPHNFASASPLQAPPPPQQQHDSDDLEAVLAASRASAAEESRKREEQRQAEEAHYLSLHESEQVERARKAEEEEERMLLEVMEASAREEREAQAKRMQRQREEEARSQLLIEESRQLALREDEERIGREHADLLARSKVEAEEAEHRRRREHEEQEAMEEAATRESLREMEKEWQRRDEEERAVATFMQHGGQLGAASYWQHLDQKKAYDLAVKMSDRLSLNVAPSTMPSSSSSSSSATSAAPAAGPSRRRPLPLLPTPGQAALAAGLEVRRLGQAAAQHGGEGEEEDEVWVQSDDDDVLLSRGKHDEGDDNDEGVDPFSDDAEAPPTYDDVREDRPPEAPTTIPSHVQFAPLPVHEQPEHNNTIRMSDVRAEKSEAYSSAQSAGSSTLASTIPSTTNATPAQSNAQSVSQRRSALPPIPMPQSTSSSLASPPPSTHLEHGHQLRPVDSPWQQNAQAREQSPEAVSVVSVPETPVEFQQRAMKGTEFGYNCEPFGTSLRLKDGTDKGHFPNLITLRKANVDGALREDDCFFVVRAPSWKALLRALAWYGNTRIEAGPEEVVDHPNGVPMRVEVEFVTPTKVNASPTGMRNAYVGVCLSLAYPSLADAASSTLMASLKNASRALDASYLRQGATRRVIALPSQAPTLPLDVVRLAQHMHRAHVFSAACPSTGSTALHSPRDLHHAVERHDIGFVAKMQRKRREQAQNDAGATGTSAWGFGGGTTSGANSSNPPASSPATTAATHADVRQSRRTSTMSKASTGGEGRGTSSAGANLNTNGRNEGASPGGSGGGGGLEEEEDDDDDESLSAALAVDEQDELDAGAVEVADATDRDSSRMWRMRARVRRRLAKRSGDARTVDEDLESWISE